MQRVILRGVDVASVRDAIGSDHYAVGSEAVRQGEVLQMHWNPSEQMLTGTVRDLDELRTVSGEFRASAGFPLRFRVGYCSCAEGVNCRHVAALVVAATDESVTPAAGPERSRRRSSLPWEQSLDSLLDATRAPALPGLDDAPDGDDATRLAIELSLVRQPDQRPGPYPGSRLAPSYETVINGGPGGRTGRVPAPEPDRMRLQARIVQMGRNRTWIAGNLSWSRIDYMTIRDEYPAAHVRLLHELYAIYRAGTNPYHDYGYGYGGYGHDLKNIDLAGCESRQLWNLLDEAATVGLALVYPRKLGVIAPPGTAQLCLDVTTDRMSLLVSPVIQLKGGPPGASPGLVPLRFVGSGGHGVVYTDRTQAPLGERARFQLARLTKPVPPQLQRLALAGEHFQVPEADRGSFTLRYYPRLARMAAMISSDGSFTAPELHDPKLVLRADYAGGHDVQIDWEWAYEVAGQVVRAPLQGAGAADGIRDHEAERRVLAGLSLPPALGPDRAVPGVTGAPVPGPSRLAGLDTMWFTTQALPLLAGQEGLAVEVTGSPADYREASDSLRIGVSADELDGDPDWFDLGITITVEGQDVPFMDMFVALASGQSHLLLDDGAYFALDKPELASLAALIEEARTLTDRPAEESLRISRFQAGLWEELAGLGEVNHQARAWQRQVQGLLSAEQITKADPPATLAALLRPYQLEGFQWLAFLWEHQLGGILADDMGLGKTLQTLALISHARRQPAGPGKGEGKPFLIVAPTSVLPNWAAEATRFTPDLKVVTLGDTLGRRGQELADVIAGADAVVTSYTLLRLDFDAYGSTRWAGLIMDEAQYVKNHQSKAYQCARKLPSSFKVAITGTPMENNLTELWSLLSVTAPGLFPNPERFRDFYARPIERGGNAELLAQLRRRIRPLIKRRTKEQVAADLPDKQEQVLDVDLDPRHRKLYQTHLQRERQKVLGLLGDVDRNRFTILRSLTLLRQLSLHAGLIDAEQAEVPSAKIDALVEQVLDVAGGGHRALVFSQFTRFLRLAQQRLEAAGIECCYLDGATVNRAAVLESFKTGTAPAFLISLKAGGFGLNLTEADYVFLLDPWWNPATEAQAVDRTHRIGQTRNVMVYRLISSGTIEEKVMALKARKAELFTSVIDSEGAFSSALDADDIRALLD
ncbi:MAG TPA: DEAD/DEAH box helicase [Trebonia sp.]|jgi:superfamily II DNA or RNA helicase|nr:DEAD/DEAH box helicase [Trebonia sp.]